MEIKRHSILVTKRNINYLQILMQVTNDLVKVFNEAQPHVVVNCVGIIKQLPESCDPVLSIALNSLLPHRLAQLCASKSSRLVHISTDCVFWRWRRVH